MGNLRKIVLATALAVSLSGCSRIYDYSKKQKIKVIVVNYVKTMESDKIDKQEYILGLHKRYGSEITASELKKEFPNHVINNLIEYSGHKSFIDEELILIKDFK